jgi:hypothetical protein
MGDAAMGDAATGDAATGDAADRRSVIVGAGVAHLPLPMLRVPSAGSHDLIYM